MNSFNSLECFFFFFGCWSLHSPRNWTLDIARFRQSRVIYCLPIINYLVTKYKGTSNSANDNGKEKLNKKKTTYTYIIFIFVKLVPLFSFNKYQFVWFFFFCCFFWLFLGWKTLKSTEKKTGRFMNEERFTDISHMCSCSSRCFFLRTLGIYYADQNVCESRNWNQTHNNKWYSAHTHTKRKSQVSQRNERKKNARKIIYIE